MLSKTDETLKNYRELNNEEFSETAVDLKPFDRDSGGAYGEFNEIREVYALMKTLSVTLNQQIFYGHYSDAYSNPLEPIKEIQELNSNLKSNIFILKNMNDKYD